ncbi:TolC family protein [Akkermansiaceae bacterium]|nr:TolC family protein [Akkermansiaceae bacterium]MDB4455945.1 TolC family protein [bacterium]MDA7863788.1 TolC family protein [Akkermansiaceae bacterium]MDA7876974.1 TolC family protein [Akkermansiaceae bacterium]MDB0055995.1 TolC family protein [Akkermansiaceae bacterium]
MSVRPLSLGALLAFLLLTGCSQSNYKKQADKDVYAILKKVEADIFGKSSEFSISSGKKAKDVTSVKVLNARSQRSKVTLSLDEALTYAIANSREYQSEKEKLYLTALTLTGERHNFRPNFFGGTRTDYSRLSDGERTGTASSNVGANQALLAGGSLGINIANDLLKYFTGDPRRSAASVLSLNITQPLLRGAGQKIAAERLTQANRNVVYAVRDYTHFQNTFSVEIVNDYFDLLQLKNVIFNEFNNYESRRANREYLTAREDRESPEAQGDAEQDELQAKNRYISSITSYRNSLDRFKITLGLPQTTELRLEDNEIDLIRKAGAKSLHLVSQEAFLVALDHRLPLFNQIDRFEDNKRQVAIAANQLKADLNIVGGSSLANDGGATDYTDFDFKNVRTTVGLQLNLPLDRLRERNNYRATLINFESATRTLGQNFDELRNLLDLRIRELEQFRQTYQIQQNAVVLAKKRVEGNQLRLKAGTVIFRRLSESQDALISAQNAETRALVDYLSARLNLLIDLGVLQTDQKRYWLKENPSNITFKQAPPSLQKALPLEVGDTVISPDKLFR